MKFRLISRVLGIGLIAFSFLQLTPIIVSIIYNEDNITAFAYSFLISLAFGSFLYLVNFEKKYDGIRVKEGFLLTVLLWLFFTIFATLPLILGTKSDLTIVSAYFEATSGLTTTGATIFSDLSGEYYSILFYRGLLQWIGGLGIIVLAIALMPLLGVGGMQLYRGETQGPINQSKLRPKIAETAMVLVYIYLILTLLCCLSYFIAGMEYFDAVVHSFTTIAIGGFSNYNESFAFFNNNTIYILAVVFMFISGISFSLHYLSFSNFKLFNYVKDPEFGFYWKMLFLAFVVFLITIWLSKSEISSGLIVSSLFTVTSFATTTGFTVLDHTSFPTYLPQLLIFIGMIGACAGSTAGGFKAIRGLVLLNHARRELKKLIHPNLVLPLKIGKKKINSEVADSVWGFLTVYLLTFLVGSFILMGQGIDTETAFSAIAACLNNLGPGLGEVAYNYAGMDAFTKVLLAFVMILGRLEIYTLLVLFTAFFWKE